MKIDPVIKKVDKRIKEVLTDGILSLPELNASCGLKKGKRLRAKLFLAFSGCENAKTVDIACSIELLHSATLIHDDVLDHSLLRRGESALYRMCGVPESILFGDYIFSEAFKLISAFKDPLLIHEMIKALSEVLKGEILEQKSRKDVSLSRKEYIKIIEMKSGCLFGVSSKLGAMIRNAKEVDPERAYMFGISAGTAYQMIDDYMDYFASDGSKENFNDIKEGVITLPLICLMKKCSGKEKADIISILGHGTLDRKRTAQIMELMDNYDVASEVRNEARKYLERAGSLFNNDVRNSICSGFDILSWMEGRISNG